MEEIVYEVIVGAIILAVIAVVIVLFRSGVGSVRETVEQQAEIENITDYDMVGTDGGIYNGTKIQEAYAYSQVSPIGFYVFVKNSASSTGLVAIDTAAKAASYPQSNRYKLEVQYLNTSKKFNATNLAPGSAELGNRGDQNIVEIRFIYVKQ